MVQHRMIVAVVAVVAVLSGTADAQKIFLGACPQPSVVQNFDLNAYLGKWYEVQKYFAIFELGGKCVTAQYSLKDNGRIKVVNSQTNILTNKPTSLEGEAAVVNVASGEAKLNVAFFGSSSEGGSGNYWVLDTDYTSYSIVWSCSGFGLFNTQLLWLLFRDQVPDPQLLNHARNQVQAFGLNVDRLDVTDQTGCPAGTR